MKILAIDPGVTTGVAIHEVYDSSVNPKVIRREFGPSEHHLMLWSYLHTWKPQVVIYERFEYRNVKHKGAEMPGIRLESREYIGIARLYCQMNPDVVEVPQTVASAMNLFTNDKLKALGLYRAPEGRQHMNDATRHLLYYVVVTLKRTDYLQALKPKA